MIKYNQNIEYMNIKFRPSVDWHRWRILERQLDYVICSDANTKPPSLWKTPMSLIVTTVLIMLFSNMFVCFSCVM